MIRPVLVFSLLSLSTSLCFGQTDTTRRTTTEPSSHPTVQIPGIDTPMSGPGTLLQSSPNPNAVVAPQKKEWPTQDKPAERSTRVWGSYSAGVGEGEKRYAQIK